MSLCFLHSQIDLLDFFRLHTLLRVSAHQPLSPVDHQQPIHPFVHHHQDVFDPDDRDTFLLNRLHDIEEVFDFGFGQPCSDLVNQEQRRLGGEGPGQFKSLSVEEGKLSREKILLRAGAP